MIADILIKVLWVCYSKDERAIPFRVSPILCPGSLVFSVCYPYLLAKLYWGQFFGLLVIILVCIFAFAANPHWVHHRRNDPLTQIGLIVMTVALMNVFPSLLALLFFMMLLFWSDGCYLALVAEQYRVNLPFCALMEALVRTITSVSAHILLVAAILSSAAAHRFRRGVPVSDRLPAPLYLFPAVSPRAPPFA